MVQNACFLNVPEPWGSCVVRCSVLNVHFGMRKRVVNTLNSRDRVPRKAASRHLDSGARPRPVSSGHSVCPVLGNGLFPPHRTAQACPPGASCRSGPPHWGCPEPGVFAWWPGKPEEHFWACRKGARSWQVKVGGRNPEAFFLLRKSGYRSVATWESFCVVTPPVGSAWRVGWGKDPS